MTNTLSAATCAIYVFLTFPVLYILCKHGRRGFLGWFFLFAFCTLRIISGGMGVKGSSSPAASIISSVGLSPLILAASGILHEARIYRVYSINKKLEWVLALFFHFTVIAGVALTASGSVKLQDQDQPKDKAQKMVRVGMAIMAASWGMMVGLAGVTFFSQRARNPAIARAGTVLFASVSFSLLFIGVRVFYSLVALCSQNPSLNPTTGLFIFRLVLGFLPELIAALVFIAAGVKTRGVAKMADNDTGDVPMAYKQYSVPQYA